LNGWEGTPIDDNNLQQLLEEYGFDSEEALEQFLNENNDTIENYEYIEDLEFAVDFYVNSDEYLDEISNLFTDFGLTEEELEKLFAHLETLDVEDPAFEEKMLELSERMIAIEEFETADELSAEQIAELFDVFSEMLELFQIEIKYYLVNDGVKQSVSFETLMTMDTTNGYDLLIEIYNKQAEEIVTEAPKASERAKSAKPPVKTIKGAKLPIYHGTDEEELEKGVGHFAGSVLPGENDNSVLSGHRDTVFRKLGEVGKGDLLVVKTSAGTFTYKVKKVRIVDKDDRTVIVPKPRATLTVSTCYPFDFVGVSPERYILMADLISTE
jgi:LPXTG-site transpeptidase (sortase) family protein